MPQNVMNEGPGLTKAVLNSVEPEPGTMKAPPAAPPQQVDKINPKARFGDRGKETRLPVDQWMKPLASYKDGVDFVPKTGPAVLHEGEKVIPAKDNMADMFEKVPGRKSEEKPKKSIKRIEIMKSHNGKHLVKHVHHHPSHEDETHVMNDMAALHSHLEDHAGTPNDGEGAESVPAGGPAQLAASAPPVPGAPTVVPGT